jgi:hypothetical protein
MRTLRYSALGLIGRCELLGRCDGVLVFKILISESYSDTDVFASYTLNFPRALSIGLPSSSCCCFSGISILTLDVQVFQDHLEV